MYDGASMAVFVDDIEKAYHWQTSTTPAVRQALMKIKTNQFFLIYLTDQI